MMPAVIQKTVNGTNITSDRVRAITTQPAGMNATSQIITFVCIRRIRSNAAR